mmetsp:Transcript_19285/g.24880  ORF Transcript_19285/g.24880 Transcript_19285/m.24880 type:complete len:505 (+) Transcript_19285:106-1620(+)
MRSLQSIIARGQRVQCTRLLAVHSGDHQKRKEFFLRFGPLNSQQYSLFSTTKNEETAPSGTHVSTSQQNRGKSDGSRFWKPVKSTNPIPGEPTRYQRPIFVAATRQHVGKTTTSLALISGLRKRFDKIGFIKPVGQQHVPVVSKKLDATIRVDKDVCLVKEHFHLDHIDYDYMSPVIIPKGYTKKFVDGEISVTEQIEKVERAMTHVAENSDVVLCEGTGHCAVGSIVALNNAKCASLIGADMVLVANGGLGSAFDELELNRILCQHYNVRLAGVVINKVIPDRYEQTKHYMAKAMMQAWGIPLLGCIPDRPFLGCPALADLENLFQTELISGQEHRFRHYNTSDINLVVTNLVRFLENLRAKSPRTLYICHVTRDDLILGFLGEHQRRKEVIEKNASNEAPFEAALIICGRKGVYQLSKEVEDMIRCHPNAPVMTVNLPTRDAMEKIHHFTPKLNIDDTNRVSVAVDHYEGYIDFDELLRRTQSSNSSFNDPSSISMEDLRRL